MKKHFLQLLFLLALFPFIKSYAEDNKAITIPQTKDKVGYRLQVPETILGDRLGGVTDRTGKSFTLSSWINMDKFTNESKNKGCVIMGHGPQVHMNYNGSLVLGTTETGKLKVIAGASNKINQPLTADVILNTWTYLTLIYNNDTHKISVYKDGVSAGEEIQLTKELELFGDDPCIFLVGGMGFSGLCDELQFFNKALSPAEVIQAYKTPQDMPSLTAWYNFNSIDGQSAGSFLNKATVANKATEQAVFYKYTGSTSSDPGLISGAVAEAAPTLASGRINTYTITLPVSITNGTLTVKSGENNIANGAKVNEGSELTITATPNEGCELEYLKVNEIDFVSGNTYAVTKDATITVAFNEIPTVTPKAIHVPVNNGATKYQFRFDDIVLGEHVNGTNNKWENGSIVDKGDHRARNFTMSVWVKPLNKNVGDLFGHAQAPFYGTQGTFGVGINNDNQLVLKSRAWISEGQCDGINALTADQTLKIDEWAFLTVAVDDDAQTIKLYKNGVLLVTGDLSKTDNGTAAHGIGLLQDECVFFAGNGGSSCDVDEIQIWSKTLSADEIITSMESYTKAPEHLIAFYKFDENSIANIPNQGTGATCNAGLVSGTAKYQGAPYWGDVYTSSPIQATLVDGHTAISTRKVTCNITGQGAVQITDDKGNVYENEVASIPNGTQITLTFVPETGYTLNQLTTGGESLIKNVTDNKYVLGTIDADRTFEVTFTLISSIHNTSAEAIVARYESGMLYIDGMNAGGQVMIYDIAGNQVKTSEISEISVSDLANGCYLVRVNSGNMTKTMKFMKR